MNVSAINFGNRINTPVNHEEMQKKAYAQILKHYTETGKIEPAFIDYYKNGDVKITFVSEKESFAKRILSGVKNLFKRVVKK